MSDNIPFDIQTEIMKRLPVKSLIRFRTVSKAWKSKIDSSDFIAHHHTRVQHILVNYAQQHDNKQNYLSFVDDHTFPKNTVFLTPPLLLSMLVNCYIIGSSHGVLCFKGLYFQIFGLFICSENIVVLWNVSIKRAIPIVVPNMVYGMYDTFLSFGVCGATNDPKIIKITYIKSESDIEKISCIPRQVEVFALSIGAWRSPCSSNLPRKSLLFHVRVDGVAVDGALCWLATDRIAKDGGYTSYNLIISFDITSEEFREVNLPDSLARTSAHDLSFAKLRESLVVLHNGMEADNPVINVWMMEDAVPKLFTKLFTINVNTPCVNTLERAYVKGFRKSGEAIVQICKNDLPAFDLVAYDPYSKHADHLGINGIASGSIVHPYIETLLLLDQPNYTVYDKMETIRFLNDLVA